MARPRKVSDEEVYGAAVRVMMRESPEGLTLGAIAAEAGVTAGALVQRFGSKRELLLTMFRLLAGSTESEFASLRAGRRSPLAVVRAYAACVAEMGATPGGLAHHLGYLKMDFEDPDFHECAAAQARARRLELEKLLGEAVTAGELKVGTDVTALARAVEVTVNGSLLTWGFHQEGSSAERMAEDLAMVLAPHLRSARAGVRKK